ncbi:Dehydrogenase, E1 component [Rozella allomycis CSF55]|uniref:Pyruvate dehydrogenase E1 component subunit alpha, mitochondrial n=1 Tax=Rozella allomycis (strain CSF55) TaxID=988480 RepID=A0A4P9YK37_ROZAC|nr:Dehydrogenase, E1 component [Rozella allomycis CSF55]
MASNRLIRRLYSTKTFEFKLGEPFITHKCDPPPPVAKATKEQLMNMYRQMVVIRRMETAADNLYKSKMIRGFCHLAIGQEAVPVGMEAAITSDDKIITAYRCHGFTYTRGGSVFSILAELMQRGKAGPCICLQTTFMEEMELLEPKYITNLNVNKVPVGAGLALAQKYMNQKNVTFSLYGDGASNQGQVFEAFNMAKLWNLPCIFVCENNKYGMGTAMQRSSASIDYYARGDYIPGIKVKCFLKSKKVNGMNVLAVREACSFAKQWALSGKGPLVMEINTYRYGGHSMSDPGTTYRTREEIQQMRSLNDPITGLKKIILDNSVALEEELKEARVEVEEAVQKATESPQPPMEEYWSNVYAKGSEVPSLRGCSIEDTHFY